METTNADEVQEKVLSVLGGLLESPGLSLEDDFFDEGGHSLLVIRAIALLKEEGIVVRARDFIEDSRISAIAARATRGA